MQTKEQEPLQEFFDLNDLKSGMQHVRDASKVVLRSLVGIIDAMLIPFRVFFSLRTSTAVRKFYNYYDRKVARNREIESELRSLTDNFSVNPDMLFLNPALALASVPVDTVRFLFDEAGTDEIPEWLKKSQDALADEQRRTTREVQGQSGILGQLAKIFFVTEARDPILDLISEASELAGADKKALEAFAAAGIDVQGMQKSFFEDLISSLESLSSTLERRVEIFSKMLSARTAEDLLGIVRAAKEVFPDFDAREIESKLKEFGAGDDDDPEAINQAIGGVVEEGSSELKKEVEDLVSKYPNIDDLRKSSHPSADQAVSLMEKINATIEKL